MFCPSVFHRATTLLELATTVAEVTKATLGVDLEPVFDLTKPEGDRGRVAVYDRAAEILGWQPTVPLLQGLETTLAWMQTNMDAPRVLVVLIGQPRGGNLAWKSLRKHLLRPYNAHLALFFTDESPTDTLLHKMAQYVWTVPEYEDWGVVWDEVARTTCPGRPVGDWRRLCGIPNQWMGGIDQCGHPAGSGILLAFRWLVQQKLAGSLLLDKYDYMVFSRADELYLCDHVDLFPVEDPGRIFLPFGEGYGGLWDRHLVGATPTFMRAINLTTELVCNTDYWYEILSKIESVNLEKVQMHMWANMSLPVGEFNRSMFTVKKDDDPTRWLLRWQNHKDQATKEFDLTVKYPQEMVDAVQHCNVNATLTIRKLQAED